MESGFAVRVNQDQVTTVGAKRAALDAVAVTLDVSELFAGLDVPRQQVVSRVSHQQPLSVGAKLSLDGALHAKWDDGVTARCFAERSREACCRIGIDLVNAKALLTVSER